MAEVLLDVNEIKGKKNSAQNLSEDALLSMITRGWEHWVDQGQDMRTMWRTCSLFAQSYQWIAVNPVTSQIMSMPSVPGRKKVTFNMIKPWLLDNETKLDIEVPSFDVTPSTLSQEDKDAALAGEGYSEHYWRALKIRQFYREGVVRQAMHFGGTFGLVDFDDTIGPRWRRQQADGNGQPLVDQRGNPVYEYGTDGDIRLDLVSYFDAFCDELPGSMDQKLWFCVAKWMSTEEIREKYDMANGKKPYDGLANSRPMQDMVSVLRQQNTFTIPSIAPSAMSTGGIVFKWYMMPQRMADKGLIVEATHDRILTHNEWPEYFGKMPGNPIVHFPWYVHPGNFRGTSPMIDQIPLQKEVNKTLSQITENKDAMLAIKWMNPDGSGVEDIDDLAGQIVTYNVGLMPTLAQPAPLPAYVFKHLNDLFVATEDTQMLHKPSKGKLPPGTRSGSMIDLMTEQDDRPLMTPENSLLVGLNTLHKKILQIASVAITEERAITFTGPNRRRQVRAFKGADLRDNTDVYLSVVGGGSKSKAAVRQNIFRMAELGLFRNAGGQFDSERFLQMLRTATPDVIYEEHDIHAEAARDENDMLEEQSGMMPVPQSWERHDIHLEEHETVMITPQWKRRAQAEPEWARGWLAHRMMHVQYMSNALLPRGGQNDQAATEQAA